MLFKNILKTLSLSLVTSLVLANDCDEIKEYLNKKYSSLKEYTIEECQVNNQGKVTDLKVNNYELKEEDVNKILSYDTIKNLEYYVGFEYDEEDERKNVPHPGFSKFPLAITKLPELENLSFEYGNTICYRYSSYCDHYYIAIEDEYLKLSKKLKKLELSQVTLNKQNIGTISALTNLEELKLSYCSYDSDGLNSLESHKNLSKLVIVGDFPKNINKVKSLKEIHVSKGDCKEPSYSFNGLNNLEILSLRLADECDFDLSDLTKLIDLSIISETYAFRDDGVSSPLSLKFPNNLKILNLSIPLDSENVKDITSLPNLEELYLDNVCRTEDFNITSLKSHEKLRKFKAYIEDNTDVLNDLVNLTYLDISGSEDKEIPQLENLKKLEEVKLSFSYSKFPNQLLTLKNLKNIDLSDNKISKIPNEIANLKNLESIDLAYNEITQLPEEFGNLGNLKYLNLNNNKLTKFPKQIGNLKKLEKLYISSNNIKDEFPESYNNLTELNTIFADENEIKGKVLQNEKLESCSYINSRSENPCRSGNEKCLNLDYYSDYPFCTDSSTKTVTTTTKEATTTKKATTTTTTKKATTTTTTKKATTTTTTKKATTTKKTTTTEKTISTTTTNSKPTSKGQCGKGIGKCKTGYCCSKYGWCGKTDDYCSVSQGCQSEFGDCKVATTTTIKTTTTTTTVKPTIKGKCGKGIGKCKTGYCCSKYGWCGKTDDYCAVSQGCQSEFGDCKAATTTTIKTTTTTTTVKPTVKGKCGKGVGSCPTGYCCSKYGWCGKSFNHCSVSEGCQSEFGICTKDNTSIEGKCGEGFGKCPSGYCCSKYGWCGKSESYCDASMGCQSKFGKCN